MKAIFVIKFIFLLSISSFSFAEQVNEATKFSQSNSFIKVQSQSDPRFNENVTRIALDDWMNSFCRGKPRVLKTITEEIGRRIEVNPALINLDRVERIKVSMWHVGLASPVPNSQSERDMYQSGCRGIFYTPKGPLSCNIHFNHDGIVTNICEDSISGGVGDNKATTLVASELLKNLYWKFAPQIPAPIKRPGQTCYDLGTGRTKACDN